MSNITIVTAFFDIGRGEWTPDKGLPHYLQRSTDTYIERFTHLTKLDNEIVVVTTPDIGERLKKIRSDIKIIEYDPFDRFTNISDKIIEIQGLDSYKKMIHPSQIKNPEYWSYKYVLVNLLKSHFVNLAIAHGLVTNDTVAWLDFGYCRSEETLGGAKSWSYDFDPEKIHLFAYKDLDKKTTLPQVIATNDVYILGAKIVANKKLWPYMESMMRGAFDLLYANKVIDDDQTLMLVCTTQNPDAFEQHRIPDHQLGLDPFVIFKDFNV
jgi:protein YibB